MRENKIFFCEFIVKYQKKLSIFLVVRLYRINDRLFYSTFTYTENIRILKFYNKISFFVKQNYVKLQCFIKMDINS